MDTLFFWFSKLFWLVAAPGNLLVWLLLASCLLLWLGYRLAARRLLTALSIVVLLIAFFPVGDWLIHPLEQRFPLTDPISLDPDGILLVGGSFSLSTSEGRGHPELNESSDRVVKFLQLARSFPDARLVFSGGSGSLTSQDFKEAGLVQQFLQSQGLDTARLEIEDQSRNTFENARNSQAQIQPASDQDWLLITSAYHMPRTFGAFCRLGWKLQAIPVDYKTVNVDLEFNAMNFVGHLATLNLATREWLGLTAYRLAGHTNRLLPEPSDECAR